uniref:Coiled-coil domain containing 127 n=1 Tax=Pipistrellus kuhlii TaxID=59472 RepID=A0A7J7YV66_PIPKU|nr:coiled-coil domain containing 127 [Pipistrellus kuhlii]
MTPQIGISGPITEMMGVMEANGIMPCWFPCWDWLLFVGFGLGSPKKK